MTHVFDRHGYGQAIPDPQWPDDAFIAVQFVLHYKEDVEAYGTRAGFWRLWRLFTGAGVPLTVFAETSALQRSPLHVKAMIEADWEIGLAIAQHPGAGVEEERAALAASIQLHSQLTGGHPLGRHGPTTHREIMPEADGFLYSSHGSADDLPYWLKGPQAPQLIIPHTPDAEDMNFAASGEAFLTALKDSFDMLYAEGKAGSPKMLSVGLQCGLAGRPGRALAVRRFIDYVKSFERVWTPKRADIARHWHQYHQ